MSGDAATDPWAVLGLAPGANPAAVRHAYAVALKRLDLAREPEAFQALRAALEVAMAGPRSAPPDDAANDAALAQPVAAFLRELGVLRRAGDTAGAMARVDRLFAEQPLAAPLLDAVGQALFLDVALERALSPMLFRHLVERFGWRDVASPAAQADPQRHSVLLARVAAEDWYEALNAAAAADGTPAGAVAAVALARGPAGVAVLDDAGQAEARRLMGQLGEHQQFVLDRFDARSLAALREAVEGPPLVVAAAPRRAWRPDWAALRTVPVGCAVLCVAVLAWQFRDLVWTPAPLSPVAQARQIPDQTESDWVSLRPLDGGVLVYFSQLVTCRPALRSVRYGLDREVPDRDFPLPPTQASWPQDDGDAVTYITAPAGLRFVSVVLTYADGHTSPVHVFRMGEVG